MRFFHFKTKIKYKIIIEMSHTIIHHRDGDSCYHKLLVIQQTSPTPSIYPHTYLLETEQQVVESKHMSISMLPSDERRTDFMIPKTYELTEKI